MSVGPLRSRSFLRLPAHLEIDSLVEEADQAADRTAVVVRLLVRPGEVLVERIADPHVPVRRDTLVRAPRLLLARLEQIHPHILGREIEARGESGLEQSDGLRAL